MAKKKMFFSEKDNINFEFLTKQIAADIKKGRWYANMIRLLLFGLFTARRAPTHLELDVFDAVFEKKNNNGIPGLKGGLDVGSDPLR